MPARAMSGVATLEMFRPAKRMLPGGGLPQAHDGAKRRGLAGAVAAEQNRQTAGRNRAIDAVQDVVGPDMRVHAFELQENVAHAETSTPR